MLSDVTDEVVEAFGRLLPQLSGSAPPLDRAALTAIAASPAVTVLLARAYGVIAGIADAGDVPASRPGCGPGSRTSSSTSPPGARAPATALTRRPCGSAEEAGARTVDLTSRPSRAAAGRLYERAGFAQRDSRVYRYALGGARARRR